MRRCAPDEADEAEEGALAWDDDDPVVAEGAVGVSVGARVGDPGVLGLGVLEPGAADVDAGEPGCCFGSRSGPRVRVLVDGVGDTDAGPNALVASGGRDVPPAVTSAPAREITVQTSPEATTTTASQTTRPKATGRKLITMSPSSHLGEGPAQDH